MHEDFIRKSQPWSRGGLRGGAVRGIEAPGIVYPVSANGLLTRIVIGEILCNSTRCEELWLGKAHIPRSSQVWQLSKLASYSISVMDGKRTRIMKEDLCDHVWEFHFNEAAPEYWRNLDPYWKGTGPPMRRYFHPDGSVTADPSDEVWGGHESSYSVVTSFVGEGQIREHYVRINRWPRMSVSRKEDWSWEMSNNLYCYTSISDAHKEGGTGPLFPFS
ncbi:hypothetical protein Acr_01g0012790 [Actinidia rufa]|uniref:Uncharacterized protein n=1 Tax=Actinidia rufa TaxID=165716 RepID=A0A7J0E4X3_9ERIC|nr:hypothetical protein Acr_01g0012790 [Actinidia rufa]